MYSKLVVSSLESRAFNGDIKACAELVIRSKAGLKRARLAIERLLALKIPQVSRDKLCESKFSPETIALYKQINKPPIIDPENNSQLLSYPMDQAGQDSWEDLEKLEFEKYGNLTAQQIFDRNR